MELWSVFKVSDKWWRDSVGVKIVGWVGVVGRCEVCKEWGNCGGVGLGVITPSNHPTQSPHTYL